MPRLPPHRHPSPASPFLGSLSPRLSAPSLKAHKVWDSPRIEVIHLDRLYWHRGWRRTPPGQWVQIQEGALQGDRWIVEGNYAATLHLRVAAADTIVFFDFPTAVCLWRSVLRVAKSRRTVRPDMADGCAERVNLEFLRFIWSFRRAKRPGIVHLLRHVQGDKHVVYLRSSGEADAFLRRVRQRAMLSAGL